LSANPDFKVLLVERGNVNESLLGGNVLLSYPPFGVVPSKGIKIVPQEAMGNRDDLAFESLSLGGRTRINATLYLPGCRAEYENWGPGWQWDDISECFSRSEQRLEEESSKRGSIQPGQTGREWKTRVIRPKYESSRQ
jgi:choline dehydrogenase